MRALTYLALLLVGCVSLGCSHAVQQQARGAARAARRRRSRAVRHPMQVRPVAPRSPAFDHSGAELDEFVALRTDGFLPEGAAISGRLEAFQPVPVSLERGRCYTMVFRLAPDARFSEHALAGIVFVYQRSDSERELHGGPGIHGPGGVASGGCPLTSGQAVFDARASFRSATDPSDVHDLGVGGYTLQLYARAISEEQLAQQAADRSVQIADAHELAERDRQRQVDSARRASARCAPAYDQCLGDQPRRTTFIACGNAFRACALEAASLPSARPTHLSAPPLR